jgi:peroxiredoxin/predicted 2-oxoglutarate/Fe(II)-dependent dioxygenase YbiX
MPPTQQLRPGDPVPWFVQRSTSRDDYRFNTVAGRYVVLCVFGSAEKPETRRMLAALWTRTDLFDDTHVAFFGVSCDPRDESQVRVRPSLPGFRLFWDFDLKIARLLGLIDAESSGDRHVVRCVTFVLDPNLRVLSVIPVRSIDEHAQEIVAMVASLKDPGDAHDSQSQAPILVVPRVFEPEFCTHLIGYYKQRGGQDSGYTTEDEGKTVVVIDHQRKRRRDCVIEDETLRDAMQARLHRRLNPEMAKAFCYVPTRIERYIVSCYDAEEGGYFRAHRDNTTNGTAHRRFAVTLNLNAEEYDGGDLRFPEYGSRVYRAPTGGAIVFSCSLLHEATAMVRGRRYAFLPFLYDEEAARVRLSNLGHVADESLRAAIRKSTADPGTVKSGS